MKSTFYFAQNDQILQPETILWFEGDGNYTRIYRAEQPSSVMAYTLKRFEKRFDNFLRVRRDALVNPRHIISVKRHRVLGLTIALSDGTILPVSRRKHRLVITRLKQAPDTTTRD